MEWTIDYLSVEHLLYIKTRGVMTRESANAYFRQIVDAVNTYKCTRQLVDHRETDFAFSIFEYYERPEVNRQLGLSYDWKVAMVFKQLDENTKFMETVFRNRGYNLHQFDNIDEARAWVLGDN